MTNNAWLLVAAWVWPLLLAWPAGSQGTNWRGRAKPTAVGSALGYLVVLGPVPGLLAAFAVPIGARLELPWLFLGTVLDLDATSQLYLQFTSVLWLIASIYSAFAMRGGANSGRFSAFFLLAMAGNLWLIVGQDLFSFYAGFAMMSLASYGLVIHDATPSALRAGRVYLVMALLGEVCLFAALIIIAQQTGSTEPSPEDLTQLTGLPIALALIGLGVKAGLVPLHLWLPLAHPAAPVAASAVLSGTMIKVAILGWLRFLPVGVTAMPEWGGVLATGGLLTLLYALPIGMVQSDPKAVLAYSSVSKMGLLMLTLGLILIQPELAPAGVAAIVFFAANHALVKGGLFLGVGLRKHAALAPIIVQPLVLGGLIFLALMLAGAPFTSGAVAKYQLKPVLDAAQWTWVSAAVAVAAVGTTLLMGRFLWISVRTRPQSEPGLLWPALAWAVLIGLAALLPFLLSQTSGWLTNSVTVPLGIVIAGLFAIVAWLRPRWVSPLVGRVPQGDLIVMSRPIGRFAIALGHSLWAPLQALLSRVRNAATTTFYGVFSEPAGDTERGLRAWPVAGALWIGILTILLIALLSGSPVLQSSTTPFTESALSSSAGSPDAPPPAGGSSPANQVAPKPALGATVPIRRHPEPCKAQPAEIPERPGSDSGETEEGNTTDSTEAGRSAERLDPAAGAESKPTGSTEDNSEPGDARTQPSQPSDTKAVSTATTKAEQNELKAPPSEPLPEARQQPADRAASVAADAESTQARRTPPVQARDGGDHADPKESLPCSPPKPYVFRVAGVGEIELDQCEPGSAGDPEPIAAPQSSRELIAAVQQTLQLRGYDPGPSDGLTGPRTRRAIQSFQRERGLEETGRISFALLDQLQQTAEP